MITDKKRNSVGSVATVECGFQPCVHLFGISVQSYWRLILRILICVNQGPEAIEQSFHVSAFSS